MIPYLRSVPYGLARRTLVPCHGVLPSLYHSVGSEERMEYVRSHANIQEAIRGRKVRCVYENILRFRCVL